MNTLPGSFSEVEASAAFEHTAISRDRPVGQNEEVARSHSPLVVFHLTEKKKKKSGTFR